MRIMKTALVVIAGVATLNFSVAVAEEIPPQATFVLTQEEFVKQREFMIKDLERKIALLEEARKCAKAAENSVAFQACNQALLNGVNAQRMEQKKSN